MPLLLLLLMLLLLPPLLLLLLLLVLLLLCAQNFLEVCQVQVRTFHKEGQAEEGAEAEAAASEFLKNLGIDYAKDVVQTESLFEERDRRLVSLGLAGSKRGSVRKKPAAADYAEASPPATADQDAEDVVDQSTAEIDELPAPKLVMKRPASSKPTGATPPTKSSRPSQSESARVPIVDLMQHLAEPPEFADSVADCDFSSF